VLNSTSFHKPVLKETVISFLQGCSNRSVIVDATLGDGGHLKSILDVINKDILILAIDRDLEAIERSKARLMSHGHFQTIKWLDDDYSKIHVWLKELDIKGVSFALFDLGVSTHQLMDARRGFSLKSDGPLDMRMDTRQHLTASVIVNTWNKVKLGDIFSKYGEEPKARRIADAIVSVRKKQKIVTTFDLLKIVEGIVGGKRANRRVHPATKAFMALRIATNDELNSLSYAINSFLEVLHPSGRIVVISYNSLEDRIVKKAFKDQAFGRMITKKPIQPTYDDIKKNPRSRSAKLRCFEKKD